ncbi:hypothetical protein [Microlunatus parietis]|uniref:Uncharacterized protein n=1 Tax=Microlunatus parietis TaxID=682979 RepID=A0A7Y9LDT1_9ACTN|nr:hypothetical protein [Microlunatus parietis]NYE73183.1 hypothetical protein [Microlunatus parietis]
MTLGGRGRVVEAISRGQEAGARIDAFLSLAGTGTARAGGA